MRDSSAYGALPPGFKPVPVHGSDEEDREIARRGWIKRVVGAVLVVGTIAAVGLSTASSANGTSSSANTVLSSEISTPAVRISTPKNEPTYNEHKFALQFENEYERSSNTRLGEGRYPYEHLVEVRRATTASLLLQEGHDVDLEACEPYWKVTSDKQGFVMDARGVEASVEFLSPGWHTVEVTVCSTSGDQVTTSTKAMSRYIRREIRQLSHDDRNAFFLALETVYKVSQKAGEDIYGSKFRSIERLVGKHLTGAAARDCDHWHDDAGIMTHHVAFTLELEQALQAVDSSVTVPYWDYTIDAYRYENFADSIIFDDEWFGPASPGSDNHAIHQGRWAYLSVAFNPQHDIPANPYGLLRSPWNTNPVPYVTRFKYVYNQLHAGWSVPGCTDFATGYTEYNSIGEIFDKLNGALHGPVHIMIGGHWNFDSDRWALEYNMGGVWLLASKFLWRQGFLRCPETCSLDTPAESCTCFCPTTHIPDSWSYRDRFDKTGLLNVSGGFYNNWLEYLVSDLEDKGKTEEQIYSDAWDVLCHVGHAGEMFTSAAPYDPTFWPLHGLADRFLQFKRLEAAEGTTTLDETWNYYHEGDVPSDTHHICDWTSVEGMQMPSCFPGVCEGHGEYDLLPWSDFIGGDDSYTNREFYEFMSPFNDDLPYAYDSFTNWPACTAQGITFWEAGGGDGDDGSD